MPTYDYQCTNCGFKFELFQNISDKPIKKCPECSMDKTVRLISGGSGLIFKGTGFYVTDYKNKKKADSKPADTKPKKKETAKSSTDKKD